MLHAMRSAWRLVAVAGVFLAAVFSLSVHAEIYPPVADGWGSGHHSSATAACVAQNASMVDACPGYGGVHIYSGSGIWGSEQVGILQQGQACSSQGCASPNGPTMIPQFICPDGSMVGAPNSLFSPLACSAPDCQQGYTRVNGVCTPPANPLTDSDCAAVAEGFGRTGTQWSGEPGSVHFQCRAFAPANTQGRAGGCVVRSECDVHIEGVGCYGEGVVQADSCDPNAPAGTGAAAGDLADDNGVEVRDLPAGLPDAPKFETSEKGEPVVTYDGVPINDQNLPPGTCRTINGTTWCKSGPGAPAPRTTPPVPLNSTPGVVIVTGTVKTGNGQGQEIEGTEGTASGTSPIEDAPGSPNSSDAQLARIARAVEGVQGNTSGAGMPAGTGQGDGDGDGSSDSAEGMQEAADNFSDGVAPSGVSGLALPGLPQASGCSFEMPTILGVQGGTADMGDTCAKIRAASEWLLALAAAAYVVFLFYRTIQER